MLHQEYSTSELRRLKAKNILFALIVVVLLIPACGVEPGTSTPEPTATRRPVTGAAPAGTEPEQSDQTRTLASLRRVDDFPLYEMHYYGDYGFGSFIQEGIRIDSRTELYLRGALEEWACTCFAALNEEGDSIFGRNFDWYVHPALVLFTDPPGGYPSVSMVDISYLGYDGEEPSLEERTALLDAPYFPFDGMNEHGLAVAIMAVAHADGGDNPDKVTIGSLHAIRLVLDYARDVDEALSLLEGYNVDFAGGPPVHYLIADSSGSSAVVEFIGGEARAIRNSEPWQVATNFVISDTAPEDRESLCWRYSRVYETLEAANGNISPAEAMTLLEDVSQGGDIPTIWSMVYNMSTGDVLGVVGREYDRTYDFLKYR
jgi:hypothetical protein